MVGRSMVVHRMSMLQQLGFDDSPRPGTQQSLPSVALKDTVVKHAPLNRGERRER